MMVTASNPILQFYDYLVVDIYLSDLVFDDIVLIILTDLVGPGLSCSTISD